MNLINAVKRRAEDAGSNVATAAKVLVVGSTLALASGAHAAGVTIDTTDIVSTITGGVTAISAIGVAVISLVVVIKLYKWVQRVL
ncbi:major capsid protein [Delftia lacustris]|uniref:major capsid protein n=1 Tax=Delftia lacustris TaxID=558537 RepID=UPI00285DDD7B|nr:major capsid protein [Delftia lacustris]MDR6731955.1 putative membrane protein [Delftia lacustris]